jgi:hypothetical protein
LNFGLPGLLLLLKSFFQLVYEFTLTNQVPEHLLILGNLKFTAIVKVDQEGSVQIVQKKKNRLFMQENSTLELKAM